MRPFRLTLFVLLAIAPAAAAQAPLEPPRGVTIVTDEADVALEILGALHARRTPDEQAWTRLRSTQGYRRLLAREAAMGRPLTDSAFRAWLEAPATVASVEALRATVKRWRRIDIGAALQRIGRYLPAGTTIDARLYFLIKPTPNTFVFEASTNPAILLYVDPAVGPAKLENTIAHELHHLGYAKACRGEAAPGTEPADRVRYWMGAFGEGLAMLAAAGGPDVHPHAPSDSVERNRWDRDVAAIDASFRELAGFFGDVLERRIVAADSIQRRAMTFFGVQGPWYTVGWLMVRTIERDGGRDALVDLICRPAALLRRYQEIAVRAEGRLPVWPAAIVDAVDPRP